MKISYGIQKVLSQKYKSSSLQLLLNRLIFKYKDYLVHCKILFQKSLHLTKFTNCHVFRVRRIYSQPKTKTKGHEKTSILAISKQELLSYQQGSQLAEKTGHFKISS